MPFDFTSVMDRHGHDALAVDGLGTGGIAPEPPEPGFDAIPLWVADMSFPTAPSITRELVERAQHPAFGYFSPSDAYWDAILSWQRSRNGATGLTREDVGYENGVLGGVVSAVTALAAPGDAVLLNSPTYIGFTHCLEENGFRIELSPLVRDDEGTWRMDLADMARRLEEGHIHVAVLCSPHNPTGRVWSREELGEVMGLFREHDVAVVSDEIWSDLVLPGHTHVPTQSVSEDARRRTVALYAPSKTFNLAGLVGSYHVIYDEALRDRVEARGRKSNYNAMNVLSMHALVGAYSQEGAAWLDELRQVLAANVAFACDAIETRYEGVEVVRPEGTYMLWLDCAGWCAAHGCGVEELLRAGWRVGVDWQDGRPFHGPTHIRMNLALPPSRLQEAFGRLDRYVFEV